MFLIYIVTKFKIEKSIHSEEVFYEIVHIENKLNIVLLYRNFYF